MAHLKMPKYQGLSQRLGKAAKTLIGKAGMRGVNIVLPVDAVVSEEKLPDDLAGTTLTKYDPEARDEGAEYEGDTSTLSLLPAEPLTAEVADGEEPAAPAGWPHSCAWLYLRRGPETIKTLSAEIAAADLVLAWGVAGLRSGPLPDWPASHGRHLTESLPLLLPRAR